jgi:hypothetical protein
MLQKHDRCSLCHRVSWPGRVHEQPRRHYHHYPAGTDKLQCHIDRGKRELAKQKQELAVLKAAQSVLALSICTPQF